MLFNVNDSIIPKINHNYRKVVIGMDGSLIGNLAGAWYFLLFQVFGCVLSFNILKKEPGTARLLLGSVFGSLLAGWMPALFSMVMGFNKASHIAALLVTASVIAVFCFASRNRLKNQENISSNVKSKAGNAGRVKKDIKQVINEYGYLLIVLPVFIFFTLMLFSHTIPYDQYGNIHAGQATNGDMNMHLAFISSIAEQGKFPPEYSLLPGTKLSYPFLCETNSSSIYLWGSSLRFAYMFPMFFAVLQVMYGVLVLAKEMLRSRVKAVIAWFFFFFNGGFGIWYFVDGIRADKFVFSRIFTEFYHTPTNFSDENLRWSNIIVDMLLPQRATLFGWAVLLPALYILYRAISLKDRKHFIVAAVMAGGLPLIHTHSFLAMAFVCAMWLVCSASSFKYNINKKGINRVSTWLFAGFLLLMCSLDIARLETETEENVYFVIALAGIACIGIICLYMAFKGLKNSETRGTVINWAILLGIVLVLALPQLFNWTFQQAQGEQFTRGYFNWANQDDLYVFFYIKNIGIVLILAVMALFFSKIINYFIILPVFAIWFVAELIVFQPNVYDNNKLLYIAYLFMCMGAASYLADAVKMARSRAAGAVLSCTVLFLGSISAILTMYREYISDYQLYSKDSIAMCRYIEENTEPEDIILTDTRYNNEVAALTGRNIVCGSGTFLYFHGLQYYGQEAAVSEMFQNPWNTELFSQYNVKYIYVSNSERNNYNITSDDIFLENAELVHQEGDVCLYRCK